MDYACRNCKKILFPNKLILADNLNVSLDVLVQVTGIDDIYRLDSELDHMRSIELLAPGDTFHAGGGFIASDEKMDANITPTALALSLFYRTHSTGIAPIEFWGDSLILHKQDNNNQL